MAKWSLDDIAWHEFDASRVQPELVSLAKAACMVEYNGHDYARYLNEVFADDEEFQAVAREWAQEEVQHGKALRKWAELADPSFDFGKSFAIFTEGYKLPLNVTQSVRGSRSGELLARCVVEVGTSSYYTAMKEYTDEPVLKAICAHIAGDEFRHFKLFYTYFNRYCERENISLLQRLKVAIGRIVESEDDELAYAFFAAHANDNLSTHYDRKTHAGYYMALATQLYRRHHIEKMTAMVFKAVGLKPHSRLNRAASSIAWGAMRLRKSMTPQPTLKTAPRLLHKVA